MYSSTFYIMLSKSGHSFVLLLPLLDDFKHDVPVEAGSVALDGHEQRLAVAAAVRLLDQGQVDLAAADDLSDEASVLGAPSVNAVVDAFSEVSRGVPGEQDYSQQCIPEVLLMGQIHFIFYGLR